MTPSIWDHAELVPVSTTALTPLPTGQLAQVVAGSIELFVFQNSSGHTGRRYLVASFTIGDEFQLDSFNVPAGWQLGCLGDSNPVLKIVPKLGSTATLDEELITSSLQRAVGSTRWYRFMTKESRNGQLVDRINAANVCQLAVSAIEELTESDAALQGARPLADQYSLAKSMDVLTQVIDKTRAPARLDASNSELVDTTIHRLCDYLEISADIQPIQPESPEWIARRLESVGCEVRLVELQQDWWKAPALPMFGFTRDDGAPVALIPGNSKYKAYNPQLGQDERITKASSQELADVAYVVYPPFPEGPLSLRTVLGLNKRMSLSETLTVVFYGVLAALAALVSPIVVGLVYNIAIPVGQVALLGGVAALLGGTILVETFIAVVSSQAYSKKMDRLDVIQNSAIYQRVMAFPSSAIRQFTVGDFVNRIEGLYYVRQGYWYIVLVPGMAAIMSISSLFLLFVYSSLLAVVTVVVLTVLLLLIFWIHKKWIVRKSEFIAAQGNMIARNFEWVQGVPKVQEAGAERRIMAMWAQSYRELARTNLVAGRIEAWANGTLAGIKGILAFVLYLVAGLLLVGQIQGGSYLAFWTALGQLCGAVVALGGGMGRLVEALARWKQFKPLADIKPDSMLRRDPGTLSGRIQVSNVSFAYDGSDEKVLHDINLDIEPGEFVAITGSSGSGKSTMLRLLLGLDHTTGGTIRYDNLDIDLLDLQRVRSQIGVVMQNARPLPGEIIDIILGESGGHESLAWEAATAAGLADEIRALPSGMNTEVGEGLGGFSAGGIQRLMIARAFAQKPPILYLDEATSALDEQTQKLITQNITSLTSTRVVVAHRLSTIRKADRVIVLDDGRIVQSGAFDELVNQPGLLQDLVAEQEASDALVQVRPN